VQISAFIQARMSSRRFPGKVLAPFRGRPLIAHVVAAVESALPDVPVVVVTSVEASDDPLVAYLESRGVAVHRGPLDDVFARFRGALERHPCDHVLRICADSPLLQAKVLQQVVAAAAADIDLVTTTHPRTFPKGTNAELIRTSTLLAIDAAELDAHDREHLTSFLHRQPERFRVVNVASTDPKLADLDLAVDTLEDLVRLEKLGEYQLP
jgi:spore coat polysaccharide biosynthesis protein SpsF